MDVQDFVHAILGTAGRLPEKTAVEASDGKVTYSELETLSGRLARRLADMGVGRESRVAVSLPRGLGELLTLLATARAGGAYIPLDPTHPPQRLGQILEDAAPQVLVTTSGSPLIEAKPDSCAVVLLDDVNAAVEGIANGAPRIDYDASQLAYILFTSGSTGRPKGVEIPRGAFSNFLRSMAHTPGMDERDRLLAVTTTSFDIAGLELFLPLYVGATVVIADKDTAKDSRLLASKLAADGISIMQATPALWRLLLDAGWRNGSAIRMLCGGEAISSELADRLLANGGELWNLYGPTETTVWSTVGRIERGERQISIGGPIDNTQIYILDADLKRVPAGTEGEICIGGDGLARGYYGRADLTAEKFVANPYAAADPRIYRTGDLGRELPGGRFQCLGRLDHQVKIRGFRVELGEIEGILRAVPSVGEALVVADRQSEVNARLIAYWTGSAARQALEAACRQSLPDYMQPAHFLPLTAFPLNTNGKIDRKQLPSAETAAASIQAGPAPRSDTEVRIGAVFRDVLGMGEVPIDRDFFALGGNSVMAAQAITRIEQELGLELSLQTIFLNPTIEKLAASLNEKVSPDAPIVVQLRRGAAGEPPVFCLFGIQIYHPLAVRLEGDRPVVAIHVPIRYSPAVTRGPTLPEIARRYVSIIREQQPSGPYRLLGLCFGGVVAYQVAVELEALGETVEAVTIIDAVLPNAVHVDPSKYVRDKLLRLRREGVKALGVFADKLLARAKSKLSRWWPAELTPGHGAGEIADYSVDGNDANEEVERLAAGSDVVMASLLVVKAADEPTPAWMTIDDHCGWQGRAQHIAVRRVSGDHLDVLREPHVAGLAAAVMEHQAVASAGKRSRVRSISSASAVKSAPLLMPTTNPKC